MVNRGNFGGILSLAAFVAAAVFFFILLVGGSLGFPLDAAGLFCLALAFVLSRFGL